jgi:ABC-type multidrug transport system ATPase subunit
MGIFTDLTVQENMILAAGHGSRSRRDRLDWIFSLFPADEDLLEPAGGQSFGRAEADALGRPRIVEPRRLILIDEPTKGLAPRHRQGDDRGRCGTEATPHDDPSRRAEFRHGARGGRHRRRDG